MTSALTALEPVLPTPRGPLSNAVIERLKERAPRGRLNRIRAWIGDADPFGIDLQLALYVCYELHYRGFAGVDSGWEWNPGLLHLRTRLEQTFLTALRAAIDPVPESAVREMNRLSVEPADGSGPSYFLRDHGTWEQMREYFAHRSLYHLKEGDPHAWAIPRLTGQAKAAFVAVEFDEYGAGRGERVHQQLFTELMTAAGLDPTYLGYIDAVSAEALGTVNLMSLFGLHQRYRGAVVGHFAATEITSSPGSRRMLDGLTRLGAPDPCKAFYREHVTADAVHEQVVRTDVVGGLLRREPHLEADVVFGIRAFEFVESRLADRLMRSWIAGSSSLRRQLSYSAAV